MTPRTSATWLLVALFTVAVATCAALAPSPDDLAEAAARAALRGRR